MTLYSKHYTNNQSEAEFGWGRNLMKSKGLSGQVSRYGFKKFNQTRRFGKKMAKAGINRVKNSGTLNKMYSAGRDRFNQMKNKFGNQSP